MTTQVEIDTAKAQAFAGQVIGIVNNATTALMLSIGHQTGLLDAMSEAGPVTSEQLAARARLNERYVREWLGAMATSGIVEHDGATLTFTLPPEHAASLTRAAGPGNLAAFTQFIPVLGNVEDGIIQAFRKGGGVPYSQFPRFQELMREESAQVFDATLIDLTLPLVPGLVERLKTGIDVADVGCGAGHAINLMARAFPNSRFIGYDFSQEGVARGRTEAQEWGLKNARFEVKDVATLDGSAQFDFITAFDAVHDQAKPACVLESIARSLRDGGTFLCVDIGMQSSVAGNIGHPLAPFFYGVSTMHCMTVSLALDGDGLGTCWGEQKALEMLADAGFTHVDVAKVEADISNSYYIARKS